MRKLSVAFYLTIVGILVFILAGVNVAGVYSNENPLTPKPLDNTTLKPGDENISERTENIKKYYLGNDSYALDISMGAVHYKDNYSDKQEQWKDIDLTFKDNQIAKAPYILTVNQDDKSFAIQDKKTGQSTTLKLTRIGNNDIEDVEKKAPTVSKGKVQWEDIATDLDLAITAENTSVSFDWIVKSENAPHEVEFEIKDGGIPIIYRGIDAEGRPVDVTSAIKDNKITEEIEKGGKYPKVINPVIDVNVSTGSDDCYLKWNGSSWIFSTASISLIEGYMDTDICKMGVGLRFVNITIPANSTITSSYISFACPMDCTDAGANSRITGNKENNPATWSTLADYQARRGTVVGGANNTKITSAQVNWDNIVDWIWAEPHIWYNSPDISAVIQELINAHAPNNEALALFWDDHDNRATNYRLAYSYNNGGSSVAPKLHVEYTVPPPAPPTGVTATDGSYPDKVRISWNASTGATGYKVYRYTSDDSGAASLIGTPAASPYDDTSAVIGTTYYYWVKATNSSGDSAFSSPVDNGLRLSPPANVAASDGSYPDKVQITWTGSTGATSYKVYRYTSDDSGSASLIGSPTATSFDDTTAPAGTTYYYWVKATNSNGDSEFSNPADTGWRAVEVPDPPAAPTELSATDGTDTSKVQITWTATSGANYYKIYRYTSNNSGNASLNGSSITTSFDDNNAIAGTTYYYWVKAANAGGDSAFSDPNTGWRAIAPPATPTGVSASDGTCTDKVQIAWNTASDATGYKVYRYTSNDSGSASLLIDSLTITSFDDTTATAGTTYYYWVKATNGGGDSGFSSPDTGWRAIAVPAAPTDVYATDGTYTNMVRITWNAVDGASGYKVYRYTSNNSGSAGLIDSPSSTYFDDYNALAGSIYYYWVKATNAGGDSGFSSPDTGWKQTSTDLAEALDYTATGITTCGNANWFGQSSTYYYGGDAAQSGQINNSQQTWIQTSVNGSGTIKFFWQVSSEQNWDYLTFYIDGTMQTRISGEVGWNQQSFYISSGGTHILKWEYSKDGSVYSGSDCGWVDKVEWLPTLAEALDYTDSNMTTGGNANWFGQSSGYYNNGDAAQSGQITDNQQTWMQTSVNESGMIKFYWQVSSEHNYDYLVFYIDGVIQNGISGEVGWDQQSYNISGSGTHVLKWEYYKDGGVYSGSDCGWVDKIEWVPLVAAPTNVAVTKGDFMEMVRITWTASSGATGYKIFRNTVNNSSTATQIGTPSASPYNDYGLSSGTRYWYWVKAYNALGNSEFSECDSGWVSPTIAGFVRASDGTLNNEVQVTWSASMWATGYKIYRNTENDTNTATQIGTSYTTSYDDTAAPKDITLYYWIRVFDNIGDGSFSQFNTGWIKGDDNILDAGAFWVSNYDHHPDLPDTDEDSQIFLSLLEDNSYQPVFNIGDSTPVSEWHFADTTDPEINPDSVDLFWFDGHGEDGDLILKQDWTFGWPFFYNYDRADGEDLVWGDSDLEWAFLHACKSLHSDDAPSHSYLKSSCKFAQALLGVHLICGADSDIVTTETEYDAQPVVEFLTGTGNRQLQTVKQAWFLGVDVYEYLDSIIGGNPVILRVIGEDYSYGSDYIWGKGTGPVSDVAVDDYYYSWDYECTPN